MIGKFLAPASALTRNLRFGAKAWLISTGFSLPLLLLLFSFWTTKQSLITATELELDGVRYARAVLEVSRKARLLRVDALANFQAEDKATKARTALDAQIADLQKVHGELGAKLHMGDAYAEAVKATKDMPGSLDTLFKAFSETSKVVKAWHRLLESTVDGSGLALDPDAESYYALQVGLVSIPRMYENLGRVINLSAAVSATGQGIQIAATEVARSDALVEQALQDMANEASKVWANRPELRERLDPAEVIKRIQVLRDLSTDDVGSGGAAQAAKILGLANGVRQTVATYQDGVIQTLEDLLRQRVKSLRWSLISTVSVTILGSFAAIYLFMGFARSMAGALRAVTESVDRVAQGDLTHRTDIQGRDELAGILHRASDMRSSLVTTIGQVSSSADQVASVSEQLRRGTWDLAERTENTASQLQKTASSMEQMRATVANTATSTHQAAQLATGNSELAARGGNIISDVVATMRQIQDSSQTISDIVGLIDSIAFQTNILALNAAVEAARAGEQGKGFAVVASEVRNLAQRSATAAKEIKSLINKSVEQTQSGARIVDTAGSTMQQIVTATARMNELLAEIALATDEQTRGIAEVNSAINELDQMTQQNAALVEETQAAATSMSEVASTMVDEVRRFDLPRQH